MDFAATGKIKGIMLGGVVKSTRAPRTAPSLVLRRSIEHVSKMLTLQGYSEKRLLLLSLNLEGDANRKMKGAIGGG
jgi:hypothetical protein